MICHSCKAEAHYPDSLLDESGLDSKLYREVPFFEGPGCVECAGTGHRGRTAITELLGMSDRIREIILEKRPTTEIRRAAKDEGLTSLREAAVMKVLAGVTTLKEINKVTFIE